MKRILCICLLVGILFGLCACMSAEEKEKMRDYEKAGERILKAYLSDHYAGAKLGEASCWTREYTGGLLYELHPTTYVCARFRYQGEFYYALTDVETGECWDTVAADQVQAELSEEIKAYLDPSEQPVEHFIWLPMGLYHQSVSDSCCSDPRFLKIGETARTLLDSGDYGFRAVLYYERMELPQDIFLGKLLENAGPDSRIFVGRCRRNKADFPVTENESKRAFGLYSYISAASMEEAKGQLTVYQHFVTYDTAKLEGMEVAWRSSCLELDAHGVLVDEGSCELQFEAVTAQPVLDNGNIRFCAASPVAYRVQVQDTGSIMGVGLYVETEQDSLYAAAYYEGESYAFSYSDSSTGSLSLYDTAIFGLYEQEEPAEEKYEG